MLSMIITLLVGGTTLLFRQTVESTLRRQGVSICGGSGCFLGIVPGQTRWADVPELLRGVTPEERTGETDRHFSAPNGFDIYQNPPGYQADRVGTIIRRINVPMWEVIQMFGWPCSVRLITRQPDSFGRFVLRYPFMEIFSNPPSGETRHYDRLSPLLPMDTILLRGRLSANESDQGSCIATTDDWFELFASWYGYAAIQTYWRHAGH